MPLTKTFHGFIENSTDTLLIIEACRTGMLPTVNRRLIERERSCIKSGTIIVFDEDESGIKRWTDGFLWSPSRILGDFLVYRELENKDTRRPEVNSLTSYNTGDIYPPIFRDGEIEPDENSLELQRERALVGSLTTSNTSYNFKKNGLIKKTIRVLVNGNYLHIINYYNKNDVLANLLPTPSKSQQLSCLTVSSDLIPHLNGCNTNVYGSPSTANTRQKVRNGRVAGNAKSEYRPYPSRNECNLIRSRSYNYHYPEPPYAAPSSLHEPSSSSSSTTATSSLPYNVPYSTSKASILDSNPTTPPNSSHTSPQTISNEPFYQQHHHLTPRMTPFTELPHPNSLTTTASTNTVNQEKHQQYHGQFQVKPIIDNGSGDRRREGGGSTSRSNSSQNPISPSPTPSPPINNSSMRQGRLVEPYYRNDTSLPINNPYYHRRTSTLDYY